MLPASHGKGQENMTAGSVHHVLTASIKEDRNCSLPQNWKILGEGPWPGWDYASAPDMKPWGLSWGGCDQLSPPVFKRTGFVSRRRWDVRMPAQFGECYLLLQEKAGDLLSFPLYHFCYSSILALPSSERWLLCNFVPAFKTRYLSIPLDKLQSQWALAFLTSSRQMSLPFCLPFWPNFNTPILFQSILPSNSFDVYSKFSFWTGLLDSTTKGSFFCSFGLLGSLGSGLGSPHGAVGLHPAGLALAQGHHTGTGSVLRVRTREIWTRVTGCKVSVTEWYSLLCFGRTWQRGSTHGCTEFHIFLWGGCPWRP